MKILALLVPLIALAILAAIAAAIIAAGWLMWISTPNPLAVR